MPSGADLLSSQPLSTGNAAVALSAITAQADREHHTALGSQHERSLRPFGRSSTLEMGIRATITHAGIVLYRDRAFGADDDVKSPRKLFSVI